MSAGWILFGLLVVGLMLAAAVGPQLEERWARRQRLRELGCYDPERMRARQALDSIDVPDERAWAAFVASHKED